MHLADDLVYLGDRVLDLLVRTDFGVAQGTGSGVDAGRYLARVIQHLLPLDRIVRRSLQLGEALEELIQSRRDGCVGGDAEHLLDRSQTLGLLGELAHVVLLSPDALFDVIVARTFERAGLHAAADAGVRIEGLGDQVETGGRIAGRGGVGDVVLDHVQRAVERRDRAGGGGKRAEQAAHESVASYLSAELCMSFSARTDSRTRPATCGGIRPADLR